MSMRKLFQEFLLSRMLSKWCFLSNSAKLQVHKMSISHFTDLTVTFSCYDVHRQTVIKFLKKHVAI